MSYQKLIKKYENKVLIIDKSIAKIIQLIIKGKCDISIDIDDLREEKANAKFLRQIYIKFIAELKTLKDA